MLAKFNVGNKLKDFSAMLGGRKGNSYLQHWKWFCGKYFFYIAHVPGAPVENFN